MSNKNIFNTVKSNKIPKAVFDLSHDVKLSGNMGDLIPVMAMDCVPGDSVRISNEALVRFMPLVAPVMHRFSVTFHNFFVPNRLLWDEWPEYITRTKVGTPLALPIHPFIKPSQAVVAASKLADYMGVPPALNGDQTELGIDVNPLPFAAYQMIYNEYYRDENLVPEVDYKLVSGSNGATEGALLTLRTSAWQHDYFTSALPFVQKGDPVLLPLSFEDVGVKNNETMNPVTPPGFVEWTLSSPPAATFQMDSEIPVGAVAATDEIFAQTSQLQGTTTINDLRRANALQRFLEKLARGGSRLSEMIRNVFNLDPQDARLDRPEYIGGNKTPITISEVLNTTGTVDLPQGNMSGHAASYIEGKNSSYFVQEHGYIITVMRILPDTSYQQGIAKHLTRIGDPTEYYFPDFANIGEQPVLNKEVYAWTPDENGTFGYVPRYAEYKYINSRTCGQMRTTLDFWTATRIFANAPALNQAFIEADPTTRIFAVEDPAEDKLVVQVYNEVKAVRPMPKFGTPSF